MKKIVIICTALFAIGGIIQSKANELSHQLSFNSSESHKYYIEFMHTSSSYGLCFFKNGGCRHWTPANAYNCRCGTYYVYDEIIYITWDNGQLEKITINYNYDGKAFINYKGRTYYDGFNAR